MNIKSIMFGKKRYVAAGLAAAALGGGAFAYAASVNVTSSTLGSGNAVVAACQAAASVSYSTSWDTTSNQFDVSGVTVTIPYAGTGNNPCSGLTAQVELYGSGMSGAPGAGTGTSTLPWNSGSLTVTTGTGTQTASTNTVSPVVSAASVTGTAVVISG